MVTVQEPTGDVIDLTEDSPADDSVVFVSQTKDENAVLFVSYSDRNAPGKTYDSSQVKKTRRDEENDNLDLPALDLDKKFDEIAKKRNKLENTARPPILCGICQEDEFYIRAHKRDLVSTHCGHIFCKPCLEASFSHYKCCPLCRKTLSNKSAYHVIYI